MQSMQITQIPSEVEKEVPKPGPRIALITPYNGGNLGDAAIQDAMISNLRLRMPGAQFFGITLDCANFVRQHGAGAFPLLASTNQQRGGAKDGTDKASVSGPKVRANPIRRLLRIVPGLVAFLKRTRNWVGAVRREIYHFFGGYRVLRTQDLLLVSGGGQLDEEYGGAWRLPFAICKWALLARLARVPCAMASIGTGKITSPASRRFVSMALRMFCYRSFREAKSRSVATNLLSRAANDLVVPDLAFSMPESELPSPTGGIRTMAGGRPVIVVSPMAYARPGSWPTPDSALHTRYVSQIAQILACLSRRGYFLVVACSSLGDDESVIPDLLGRMDEELKSSLDGQIHFPTVRTWRDLVAVLLEADYLIASRLHGTILGFVTQTPAVAISFDPKVDWVMEDLHQTDSLLHIRDFTAEEVLNALDRIKIRRDTIVEQLATYRRGVLSNSPSARQYDFLAGLALKHQHSHN
jgi:polysaccharide pyruvyl transferase WcaK-like protein